MPNCENGSNQVKPLEELGVHRDLLYAQTNPGASGKRDEVLVQLLSVGTDPPLRFEVIGVGKYVGVLQYEWLTNADDSLQHRHYRL